MAGWIPNFRMYWVLGTGPNPNLQMYLVLASWSPGIFTLGPFYCWPGFSNLIGLEHKASSKFASVFGGKEQDHILNSRMYSAFGC